MYQVTIIWQGAEIGYGEGESLDYAKEEATDNVSDIYRTARNEWKYEVRRSC